MPDVYHQAPWIEVEAKNKEEAIAHLRSWWLKGEGSRGAGEQGRWGAGEQGSRGAGEMGRWGDGEFQIKKYPTVHSHQSSIINHQSVSQHNQIHYLHHNCLGGK